MRWTVSRLTRSAGLGAACAGGSCWLRPSLTEAAWAGRRRLLQRVGCLTCSNTDWKQAAVLSCYTATNSGGFADPSPASCLPGHWTIVSPDRCMALLPAASSSSSVTACISCSMSHSLRDHAFVTTSMIPFPTSHGRSRRQPQATAQSGRRWIRLGSCSSRTSLRRVTSQQMRPSPCASGPSHPARPLQASLLLASDDSSVPPSPSSPHLSSLSY